MIFTNPCPIAGLRYLTKLKWHSDKLGNKITFIEAVQTHCFGANITHDRLVIRFYMKEQMY